MSTFDARSISTCGGAGDWASKLSFFLFFVVSFEFWKPNQSFTTHENVPDRYNPFRGGLPSKERCITVIGLPLSSGVLFGSFVKSVILQSIWSLKTTIPNTGRHEIERVGATGHAFTQSSIQNPNIWGKMVRSYSRRTCLGDHAHPAFDLASSWKFVT